MEAISVSYGWRCTAAKYPNKVPMKIISDKSNSLNSLSFITILLQEEYYENQNVDYSVCHVYVVCRHFTSAVHTMALLDIAAAGADGGNCW